MSYKFGLLLSMFFLIQVFLFSGDLACIQSIHSQLDAVALTASYQISMQGAITDGIRSFVFQECGADIYYVDQKEEGKAYGEAISFYVSKKYLPFIISSEAIVVTVRRTAVIGYFR